MKPMHNSTTARDIAYHLHPYTNAIRQEEEGSLIITRGEGVYVYDEDGKPYIEGLAGLWSASLGFKEQRLIDAAVRQMNRLPFYHTFTLKGTDVAAELAEKLVNLAPVPMSKVFFTNSGSEANDTVVKMVRFYNNAIGRPAKKKFISRLKGYHGVTLASASLTGLPYNHKDFDLPLPGFLHTDCPHYYRNANPGESEEAFASRMADTLEKLILSEGPDTIAAFIAEPVQGSGGVIIPPKTYFEKIQAVLKKYDILMVADEVISGFGRLGTMFGSQALGIMPDIITCAKALSSSFLPIGAVLINQKIYEGIRANTGKLGTFGHGFTYSGHPVCAAVALETLRIYEDDRIIDQVKRLAPVLQEQLQQFADHPMVGEVRALGLIGAVELVKNKETKESFDTSLTMGLRLIRFLQARGAILRPLVDSIAFCPPLIISEVELKELVKRFAGALDDLHQWAKAEGVL